MEIHYPIKIRILVSRLFWYTKRTITAGLAMAGKDMSVTVESLLERHMLNIKAGPRDRNYLL